MWHLSIDGAELESSPWRLKRDALLRANDHAGRLAP